VGTQHVIEEADLDEILGDEELPVPEGWKRMFTGERMPNIVAAIRQERMSH